MNPKSKIQNPKSLPRILVALLVSSLAAAGLLLPRQQFRNQESEITGQEAKSKSKIQNPKSKIDGTSPDAKRQFDQARKLLRQDDFENALAAVRGGLKIAPQSVEGLNLLGIVCGQKQEYAQAVAAFQRALKLSPRSLETRNNLGNSYFTQKKLDLAEQEFQKTLRYDPHNRDANYNLGLVLLAKGNPQGAIVYLRRVQPPDPSALFNLTQAYFRAGQPAKGLELARLLSDRAGNDVRLRFTLGVFLASEKQYKLAIQELELADALKPGTFEILHDLGQAYLRTQDYAKAEEVLQRAVDIKPDSADTLYLLAQVYADQRKDVQALELLVRARKLAPQNTDVIFLMSRLSMMQSFYEDAIQLLEEGLKIAPKRADLHAALGESYFAAGKVDKAVQEFRTLIRLDPSARSYAFMGLCYRHLGRFDEAKKYFGEGLKIDPRSAPCLFNLGYIENKQGNYGAAEKLLYQALRADPSYDDALYEMAGVKMAQNKYEEAISLLRRCAKVTTKPAEVYYKLATAERKLRQMEAAQRDLKIFETLSKDPSPGPYPLQHFFEYLNQRAQLPAEKKAEVDLEELLRQVDRQPDQPRNLYLLAETYLKLGRVEEARKTVERLDKLSGGDARTALGAGVMLARYRMYPEAIQHFQKAIAADPASDDSKYNLANAYFQTHEYPQALQVIEQVSPQGQNDENVLALWGDIYAHLGRAREAVDVFRKQVQRNPDNDQGYLSLALSQMRAGEPDGAEQTLRRGLSHIPDSGKLFWGMGVLSVLKGNNAQAEANFKKAAELMPDWQSSYAALGVFYYETGQLAAARNTLDRYSRLFPHGGLSVSRIQQALQESENPKSKTQNPKSLSPEARLHFLQIALTLADQNP